MGKTKGIKRDEKKDTLSLSQPNQTENIFNTLIFNTYDSSYYYSVIYKGKIYYKDEIKERRTPKKIFDLCTFHEDLDDVTSELVDYIRKKFKEIKTLIYSNNGSTIIVPIRL